jgi:hypothetical protein
MDEIFADSVIRDKFEQIIVKIPVFLRGVARQKVTQRLKAALGREGRSQAGEKDLVDAFFAETPFGFHGPLKTDMQSIGIDYTQYGYDK